MKITTPDGLIVELADGETIPAELMPRIMGTDPVTAVVAPVPPAPPAPTNGSLTPFLPLEEFANSFPRRRRRPTKCYMTEIEHRAMEVMLENPNGISSEDLATVLGVTHSSASSTLHRIRITRPYKGKGDRLLLPPSRGLHKITDLGAKLNYLITTPRRTPKLNEDLGWGL